MNTPSERLQAIKEQNAEAVRLKHKTPPGPPPPPMDWREPTKNPRMVKLRRFEPGRVPGSREKSEIEQVSLGEGEILLYSKDLASSSAEDSILRKGGFSWISCNKSVESYLQGSKQPMCGLAASLMAAEAIEVPFAENLDLDDFFEMSKERGYTKQGEMFEAHDLAKLIEEILLCETEVLEGPIDRYRRKILEHLAEGYPFLIPHDADHDHRPTKRNGEKSHWGIVTGFLVGANINTNQKGIVKTPGTKVKNHFFCKKWGKISQETKDAIFDIGPEQNPLFLFAKQGRAPGLKIWDWKALAESNAQLFNFDASRFPGDYILPAGGPAEGLNEKSILIRPKSHTS